MTSPGGELLLFFNPSAILESVSEVVERFERRLLNLARDQLIPDREQLFH
jgi:hypothetical protein